MPSNSDAELTELGAGAAVRFMRAGELSAERYAGALLEQARRQAGLNAFRALDIASVLESARAADLRREAGEPLGLLHGLPLPVKDSINTRALPTTHGTRSLEKFRPRADAAVLELLFAQGAFLMGKTNLHEISRGWTSNNGTFGAVLNPYDVTRIPGGSSGGSTAAVAARMAPMAVAEDTLGSIRVPASLCGVAGLRPTFGRYPGAGIMALTLGKFDQVGPVARSVADLALFDAAVTGETDSLEATGLARTRIGVGDYYLAGLDSGVERVVSEALGKLARAGATIVRTEVPAVLTEASAVAATIIGYENVASISAYLRDEGTGVTFAGLVGRLSPNQRDMLRNAAMPTAEMYAAALETRARIQAETHAYFASHALDVLAFPPVLAPAPPLGDNLEFTLRGASVPIRTVMARNTALGSCASLASLVLPAGLTGDGLPVGMEFCALPGRDRALLAIGLAIESVLGTLPPPEVRMAHG